MNKALSYVIIGALGSSAVFLWMNNKDAIMNKMHKLKQAGMNKFRKVKATIE